MQMLRSPPLLAQAWLDDVFAAKAVGKGGIVREQALVEDALRRVQDFVEADGI